jgi:hypothetical protein
MEAAVANGAFVRPEEYEHARLIGLQGEMAEQIDEADQAEQTAKDLDRASGNCMFTGIDHGAEQRKIDDQHHPAIHGANDAFRGNGLGGFARHFQAPRIDIEVIS